MVAFVLIFIALLWILCFVATNDLFLPTVDLRTYRRILCIFAHPDDETVLTGGTMASFIQKGCTVLSVTATQDLDPAYANLRGNELRNALQKIGVTKELQWNFPDGSLSEHESAFRKKVRILLQKNRPDLVITFDTHGWYGHPDHITCSHIVTKVVKEEFHGTTLWYAVRASAIQKPVHLSAMLRKNLRVSERTKPNKKLFLGISIFKKIQAVYAYKSQMNALKPGLTIGPIPIWFSLSASPFEYIREV